MFQTVWIVSLLTLIVAGVESVSSDSTTTGFETTESSSNTASPFTSSTHRTVTVAVTPEEVIPSDEVSANSSYCRFGKPILPLRDCAHQRECQTDFLLNRYCSEKERCCQEEKGRFESLCFEKRLPLFGEERCETNGDCGNRGALCKEGHCCPNFHYKPYELLEPPTHFYSSNFPCVPGQPIPPGFQFAFCSNFTRTIAYLGVVNKCGTIQHIVRGSQCKTDADCFDGTVCVFIVDDGVCFRNPEVCYTSTLYKVAWISCLVAFHAMLLYYVTRACYVDPMGMSRLLPHVVLQLYDVTKEAQNMALRVYQRDDATAEQVMEIRRRALAMAMVEEEVSMDRPALEYFLYWMGIVVDRPSVEYVPGRNSLRSISDR